MNCPIHCPLCRHNLPHISCVWTGCTEAYAGRMEARQIEEEQQGLHQVEDEQQQEQGLHQIEQEQEEQQGLHQIEQEGEQQQQQQGLHQREEVVLDPAAVPLTALTQSARGQIAIRQNSFGTAVTRRLFNRCASRASTLPLALRVGIVALCGLLLAALVVVFLQLHFTFVHACDYEHTDDLLSAIIESNPLIPPDLMRRNDNTTNLLVAVGVMIDSSAQVSTAVQLLDSAELLSLSAAQDFVIARDPALVRGKSAGPVLWVQANVGSYSSVWRGWLSSALLDAGVGYEIAVLNSVDCFAERLEVSTYLAINSQHPPQVNAYSAAAAESTLHRLFKAVVTLVTGWISLVVLSGAIQLQLWVLMAYAVPALAFCFSRASRSWFPSSATLLEDLYGADWFSSSFWVMVALGAPLVLACGPTLTCRALLAWYSNIDDIWMSYVFMACAESTLYFLCQSAASKQLVANTAPIVLLTYTTYIHTFYYNGYCSLAAAVTLCVSLVLCLVIFLFVEAAQRDEDDHEVSGPMAYDLSVGPPPFWLLMYSWQPSWYLRNDHEDGWHVQRRDR